MRTVIYCRKSTDRSDMQMQSLDIQLEWALDYCKKNKMNIVETIVESKSASKITWREWFAKMVEHFEKWSADHLVVYNIDRIARNPLDEWNIKWLAQQWKIKKIHSPQWLFDWRQILVLSLHMAMANQYTIDLSARIVDWKKRKVENGKISWRAPLWYENDKDNDCIDPKKNEALYIKRIFEMRAEKHSLELIRDQIYTEGFRTRKWLKVSKMVIERIIKNPFYYWMIVYKEEMFKWEHTPLVSKKLWEKANSHWRGIVLVFDRNLTPLKWKVIHKESWETMSVSLIKKKYIYFHIHHRKNVEKNLWYLQKKMIDDFEKNIDLYCVPEEEKERLKEAIFAESWLQLKSNKNEKNIIEESIIKLETEKSWLVTMRRTWELSSAEFLEEKNKIINQIEDFQNKLINLNRQDDVILSQLDKLVELFINLKGIWKKANIEQKIVIISSIVVELKIDYKKRLYIAENPLFKAFRLYNTDKWWTHRATIPGPIA